MIDIVRERSYPTPLSTSPLLPLLLLSLARQKNSPTRLQIPASIDQNYDYVIVGAGSAGSTVAARLSEVPCANVLLLEAGKSPPIITDVPAYVQSFRGSDIDWQYKTTPQKYTGRLMKNRQLALSGGKCLGGSSVLNYMMYVRGNKKNYNDWEAQGAKGWSYKDVLPYFKKMEDNRNYLNRFHGVGGPITVEKPAYKSKIKNQLFKAGRDMGYNVIDINGRRQTGFSDYQATIRNQQRCSTAKGYLVPAENRTNLHILPNAFVRQILIENNTAVGVLFEVNGKEYKVKARREVIVSAGTMNTPKLLMLSGIGPKKELQKFKIPVYADLPVGENLHDHCTPILAFELYPRIPTVMKKLTNRKNIRAYINNRKGILTVPSLMLALAFLNDEATRPIEDDPKFELYFYEAVLQNPGITDSAFKQLFAPYINSTVYTCHPLVSQPRSRGYIRLQSADPHTPPLINPNYFAHPKDLDDMVDGMKVCQRIGTSKAMQKLGSRPLSTLYPGCEEFQNNEDQYFRCQAQSLVMSGNHYVGTVKMGDAKDPTTVVDPKLRVKGIKNLRVVDASVMPIIPSGNTNAPTIMVAEKAADIIKQNIRCRYERSHRKKIYYVI